MESPRQRENKIAVDSDTTGQDHPVLARARHGDPCQGKGCNPGLYRDILTRIDNRSHVRDILMFSLSMLISLLLLLLLLLWSG